MFQEGDGAVTGWVCERSFAFVDLDHYCFAPVVRDGGCEKGLVEDPEERCLVVFVKPLPGFRWKAVRSWSFVVC